LAVRENVSYKPRHTSRSNSQSRRPDPTARQVGPPSGRRFVWRDLMHSILVAYFVTQLSMFVRNVNNAFYEF